MSNRQASANALVAIATLMALFPNNTSPVQMWYRRAQSYSLSIDVPGYGNVQVAGTILIEAAILIPLSVLVAAVLIPPAFTSIYGANTSGWNSSVVTVFQVLLPVLTVIAVAYQYVRALVNA